MLSPLVLSLILGHSQIANEGFCTSGSSENICSSSLISPEETLSDAQLNSRTPNLLVFVSFSMPMETLKLLGKQVNALGGALVFRGILEDSFQRTALKFKELGQKALIDPTLFETYRVEVVPTFVLKNTALEFDRLTGNVLLTHALEQFAEKGDLKDLARDLLNKNKESRL